MASAPNVMDELDPHQHAAIRDRRPTAWSAATSATRRDIRDWTQLRAARRLHLQRRRQQRPRHPRRQRPLLRDAGLERHLQPAGLQQPDHGDASPTTAAPTSSPIRPTASPATTFLNGAAGARRSRRASSSTTSAPVHVAEQHRLPEAAQQRDRASKSTSRTTTSTTTRAASMRTCSSTRQPATTAPVAQGRPNRAYGQVLAFTSDGHRDQTQLSTALTRRLQDHLQAGAHLHADVGDARRWRHRATRPGGEQPVRLSRRRVRHVHRLPAATRCASGRCIRCRGASRPASPISTARATAYGASISATPYGKTGTNRLNLANNGGPAATINIPADVRSQVRWAGVDHVGHGHPAQRAQGAAAAQGRPAVDEGHPLGGTAKATLIAEVFNLFNHANYGSYNDVAERHQCGDDGAVRPPAADRWQCLRAAAGAARIPDRVLAVV